MQVEKVGRLEILVASLRSRNDILATRSMDLWQIEVDGPKTSISSSKSKDSHFKEVNRDEDRPASGAPSRVKTKGKVKYKCKKDNSERGDCTRWITRGQCSFGDSCALTHEPNKRGRGKGRFRSPSPTGSPHRTSNGDGKGSDDGGLKGTQKFAGKSPSGKRTDHLEKTSSEEVVRRIIHVIIGTFLNVSKLYRIQCFEHDQTHMCDLESDLNAWTCALQLTPFFSHCPLKRAQRAGHRFTLIFIEQKFKSPAGCRFGDKCV